MKSLGGAETPQGTTQQTELVMQKEITADYLTLQGLSQDFPNRFWMKVKKSEGCWIWIGALASYGYGKIATGFGLKPRNTILVHRASWILNFSPIPNGSCVLHHCDNRLCVRPDHLWLGNRTDNAKDRDSKQRLPWGENAGSAKLTQNQVNAIRMLANRLNQCCIASKFGINQSTVSRIVNFERWNTHL